MKKTKYIRLVLITALLSSCNRAAYHTAVAGNTQTEDSVFICSEDSCGSLCDYDLWYSAFRPIFNYFSIFFPSPVYSTSLVYSRSGILRRGFGRPFLKSSS